MRTLIRNSTLTPDGTHLISRHRHDYVEHTDTNGKTYAIDGGLEYRRLIGDHVDCVDTSVYTGDSFWKIRKAFAWGTYGPNGDQPLKHVILKDMDTDHIKAILETQPHISDTTSEIFHNELNYRTTKESNEKISNN